MTSNSRGTRILRHLRKKAGLDVKPEPQEYTPEQIDEYLAETYISPWNVVTTTLGIGWALFCALILAFSIMYQKIFSPKNP